MEKTIDRTYTVTEPEKLDVLVIREGAEIQVPAGKRAVLTVNGRVTELLPGEYRGDIRIELIDEMPRFDRYENDYRSVLAVDENGVSAGRSVLSGIRGELTDEGLINGQISVEADRFNGISIDGGTFRVTDTSITLEGNGGDDFELFGAALAVAGDAKVVADHVDIRTHGVAASGIQTAGRSDVLIRDSVIRCSGGDNTNWYCKHPHLSETPWVLGLRGTLRATNLLDASRTCYYNTHAECDGWGVYSVDNARDASHILINSDAVIRPESGFGSGYGAYLNMIASNYFGIRFDVPDFAFAVGGHNFPVLVGPSSRENLESMGDRLDLLREELGGSFDPVQERPSVIRSGKFIGMWHHSSAQSFTFQPGTILEAGDTAFLIKSSARRNMPKIYCDGVKIRAPRIVHLMESDDAGMGSMTHDGTWAPCKEVIFRPVSPEGFDRTDPADENNAVSTYRNMDISGDFYNSVWSTCQNLYLRFEGCRVEGFISAATAKHRHVSYLYAMDGAGNKICTDLSGRKYVTRTVREEKFPAVHTFPDTDASGAFVYDTEDTETYTPVGYGIWNQNPEYLADMDITPSEPAGNGVIAELTGGTRWTVPGDCWLTSLTIEEGSEVLPPAGKTLRLLVDGEDCTLGSGVYRGNVKLEVR